MFLGGTGISCKAVRALGFVVVESAVPKAPQALLLFVRVECFKAVFPGRGGETFRFPTIAPPRSFYAFLQFCVDLFGGG